MLIDEIAEEEKKYMRGMVDLIKINNISFVCLRSLGSLRPMNNFSVI